MKPLARLAKDAGVARMSKDAVKALKKVVLDEAEGTALQIVSVTKHAERKTVMGNDVTFVVKKELPI